VTSPTRNRGETWAAAAFFLAVSIARGTKSIPVASQPFSAR
jgi:hypothetical protein